MAVEGLGDLSRQPIKVGSFGGVELLSRDTCTQPPASVRNGLAMLGQPHHPGKVSQKDQKAAHHQRIALPVDLRLGADQVE